MNKNHLNVCIYLFKNFSQEDSLNTSFSINKQYEEILEKEEFSLSSRLLSVKFVITAASYIRQGSDSKLTTFLQESYEAFLFNKIDPSMAEQHVFSKISR